MIYKRKILAVVQFYSFSKTDDISVPYAQMFDLWCSLKYIHNIITEEKTILTNYSVNYIIQYV